MMIKRKRRQKEKEPLHGQDAHSQHQVHSLLRLTTRERERKGELSRSPPFVFVLLRDGYHALLLACCSCMLLVVWWWCEEVVGNGVEGTMRRRRRRRRRGTRRKGEKERMVEEIRTWPGFLLLFFPHPIPHVLSH